MDVIQSIRASHGADDTDSRFAAIRRIVERACALLSKELYKTRTHFLHEFVQNADDNQYPPGVRPTLNITVGERQITIECNEVGFSEADVRSICDVGNSTKKGDQDLIGEKGIGFKAAFTVASAVHIASNAFTFKFDISQPSGFITPIWQTEHPVREGWTTFVLDLLPGESGADLGAQLDDLKPTSLLFLRSLRSINMDVTVGRRRTVSVTRVDPLPCEHLTKLVCCQTESGTETRTETCYVLVKRLTETDPEEPKRIGIAESTVVLAFPLQADGQLPDRLPEQDVHAFLPVRSYGYPFLVQADFLLASSREDILKEPKWNDMLFGGVAEAFLDAVVNTFPNHAGLRDSWFRLIPKAGPGLGDAVLRRLRSMCIIRDASGLLRKPTVILNPGFCDNKGRPLVPENCLKKYYISNDYDVGRNGENFYCLGVRDMDLDDFIYGLFSMEHSDVLRIQSDGWHEDVSKHLFNHHVGRGRVANLHILPLPGGGWARGGDAHQYVFDTDLGIPEDLGMKFVALAKLQVGPWRRAWCSRLGVQVAKVSFIAREILNSRSYISHQALLTHTKWLFQHRHLLTGVPGINGMRVGTVKSGHICSGSSAYSDGVVVDGSIEPMPHLGKVVPATFLLGSSYLSAYEGEERNQWFSWLCNTVGISMYPRIYNGSLDSNCSWSELSAVELLEALSSAWHQWPKASRVQAIQGLSKIDIVCLGGETRPLKEAALKLEVFAHYKGDHLHFLPLGDNPPLEKWGFLRHVGVLTEVNVAFFVQRLVQLQKGPPSEEIHDEVLGIYRQLDSRFYEDAKLVTKTFENTRAFLVATQGRGYSWCCKSEVYWNGPSSLVSRHLLAKTKHYLPLKDFFSAKLGLLDAPLSALVKDVQLFCSELHGSSLDDADVEHVYHMLADIGRQLDYRQDTGILHDRDLDTVANLVRNDKIFPVTTPDPGLVTLRKAGDFYIPDRSGKFVGLFGDIVSLLKFPPAISAWQIRHLYALLDHEKVSSYFPRLEKSVIQLQTTWTPSELFPDEVLTESIRCRMKFVAREQITVKTNQEHYARIMPKLCCSDVVLVDSLRSAFRLGDMERLSEEKYAIIDDDNSIRIMLCVDSACEPTNLPVMLSKALAPMLRLEWKSVFAILTMPLDVLHADFEQRGIPDLDKFSAGEDDEGKRWLPTLPEGAGISINHAQRWRPRGTVTSSTVHMDGIALSTQMQHLDVKLFEQMAGQYSLHSFSDLSWDVHQSSGFSSVDITALSHPVQLALFPCTKSAPSSGIEASMSSMRFTDHVPSTAALIHSSTLESQRLQTHADRQSEDSHQQLLVGTLGEFFVFRFLQSALPDFGPDNWTSELRANTPGFKPYEGSSLADFTYQDSQGELTSKLFGEKRVRDWRESWPRYYLEVKSTSGPEGGIFHLSANQLQTIFSLKCNATLTEPPEFVYVLIRVSQIMSGSPQHRFFPNPYEDLGRTLQIVSDVEAICR